MSLGCQHGCALYSFKLSLNEQTILTGLHCWLTGCCPWPLVVTERCKTGSFFGVSIYECCEDCCGKTKKCTDRDDNSYQRCCFSGKPRTLSVWFELIHAANPQTSSQLPNALLHHTLSADQTVCGGECCKPDKCYVNTSGAKKCCADDSEWPYEWWSCCIMPLQVSAASSSCSLHRLTYIATAATRLHLHVHYKQEADLLQAERVWLYPKQWRPCLLHIR